MNGSVNIRLCFLGEVDSLCIASTLKVENAIVVPAMLVVADESSLRIGREGGFAYVMMKYGEIR